MARDPAVRRHCSGAAAQRWGLLGRTENAVVLTVLAPRAGALAAGGKGSGARRYRVAPIKRRLRVDVVGLAATANRIHPGAAALQRCVAMVTVQRDASRSTM
jgi:hypothetical protein